MKWLSLLIVLYSIPCNANCLRTIHIRVDKDFNKVQKQAVSSALNDWYLVSKKQICFKTVEANLSKVENFMLDNQFTIYSGNHPWHYVIAKRVGCEYNKDYCLGITVRGNNLTSDIFVIGGVNKFASLIRHEIGHVIGLSHSKVYEDVMYPRIRDNMPIGKRDATRLQCLIDTGKIGDWNNDCE